MSVYHNVQQTSVPSRSICLNNHTLVYISHNVSDTGELRNANHLLNVVLTFDKLQPVPGFIYLYVCLSVRPAHPVLLTVPSLMSRP